MATRNNGRMNRNGQCAVAEERRPIHCAIYSRKSTEEGLQQDHILPPTAFRNYGISARSSYIYLKK